MDYFLNSIAFLNSLQTYIFHVVSPDSPISPDRSDHLSLEDCFEGNVYVNVVIVERDAIFLFYRTQPCT